MKDLTKADVIRLIEAAIREVGTAAALARRIGVAPSTITRGLDPTNPQLPSTRTISKIAGVVRQSVGNVVDEITEYRRETLKAMSIHGQYTNRIPIAGE